MNHPSCRRIISQGLSAVLLAVFLQLPARADEEWALPLPYRVGVTIEPHNRLYAHSPAGVSIDFNALSATHAIAERADYHSLHVVCISSGNDQDNAATVIPHAMTGDFANTNAGRIWWRMPGRDALHYHIYFGPLPNEPSDGSQAAGASLPKMATPVPKFPVGVGDAFRYNDGQTGFAGNVGLHSTYWHLDWNGDGASDLIGFGLRYWEFGQELGKELGNAVYFYPNLGTPAEPLFGEPWRVRSEDGQYLHNDYLYQNAFPADWDEDGDTDFFAFPGQRNELALYENTGERDRNGLYLLKPMRTLMTLPLSDYRETFPSLYDKPYFAHRGGRLVDWEGDGDRDLIVSFLKVNKIGRQDPSKGIIPYGSYLVIFEVFENTGTDDDGLPEFARPVVLRDERGTVITSCTPAPGGPEYVDWDGDGDLDLLFADMTNRPLEGERLMFCENVGTRSEPLFIRKIPLLQASQSPQVVDWNGDGRFDLIAGGEFFVNVNARSGRSSAEPNTDPLGTYHPRPRHFPRMVSHGLAQTVNPLLMSFFTVSVDWDGDGILDLLGGYRSNVVWYRNQGTLREPVFARREAIDAGGKPIYLPNWLDPQAEEPSHWGPQGPGEAEWGWANPSTGDWDGDGDLDLFVTAQRWQVQYFENVGSRTQPRLAAGREVRCGGDPHAFSWRSKVALGDIDDDSQMEMVVTSHQDNVFTAFAPAKDQPDPTKLEMREVAKLALENGEPVKGWYGGQNNNGDNHGQLVDWDGDGDLDLLNGSLWAVWYYENVGTAAEPTFRGHGKIKAGGRDLHTFNHAGSFDAADWSGDGRLDLIMGAECPSDQPMGSRLHLFDRAFIEDVLPQTRLRNLERRPSGGT